MTNKELYEKYPHIIPGSIEIVPIGKIIINGKNDKIISLGKIAVIKCANNLSSTCLKSRLINIQDAKQVKFCTACTRKYRNQRRRERRKLTKVDITDDTLSP